MRVQISFQMELPPEAEQMDTKQLEAWASYCCGATCQLAGDNPLADYEFDAEYGSVNVRCF